MNEANNLTIPAWLRALLIPAFLGGVLYFSITTIRAPETYQKSMAAKDVVMHFTHTAFDEGKLDEAFDKYVSPDLVDHNPKVEGTRDSVLNYLKSRWNPDSQTQRTIYRVMSEGDLVVVHHHLVIEPGTNGYAFVEIFRVKDGKIVEHWDVTQPVPDESVNPEPVFEANAQPFSYNFDQTH